LLQEILEAAAAFLELTHRPRDPDSLRRRYRRPAIQAHLFLFVVTNRVALARLEFFGADPALVQDREKVAVVAGEVTHDDSVREFRRYPAAESSVEQSQSIFAPAPLPGRYRDAENGR